MSQQLGKVEKPLVSEFKAGRKLFFVPLVFTSPQPEPELLELVNHYWDQVQVQVTSLADKLSRVKKVYHELIPNCGKKGIQAIKELSTGSHRFVKSVLDNGAKLQPIEDSDLLAEFMDWSRCSMVGLQSQAATSKVYQSYIETQKRRNDQIARQLDKTLKGNEAAVLLMREGHQVQFPSDIEVFYVAPPSLDEIKRWFRAQQSESQA